MATYDGEHRALRDHIGTTLVAEGLAHCAELICLVEDDGGTRWIRPGTPWDLAHDRRTVGAYLGPAHRRCNRAEGARHNLGTNPPDPDVAPRRRPL